LQSGSSVVVNVAVCYIIILLFLTKEERLAFHDTGPESQKNPTRGQKGREMIALRIDVRQHMANQKKWF